jgi:uncharacterized DUF497 family protein
MVHDGGTTALPEYVHFDWDGANCGHVGEAGVEPRESQEAVLDPQRIPRAVYNVGRELRRGIIGGAENGRVLFVVFTLRGRKTRVITARAATAMELRRYRRRGK